MTNEDLKKKYPIQDDIWVSRRWNKEMTDYVDLSGHEDTENIVTVNAETGEVLDAAEAI